MEKIIKQFFYDPETGFTSAKDVYNKLIEAGYYVTQKQVKDFISKQETAQINKEYKKPTIYNTIISPAPRNNYQIDIIIYDRYEFNKYKYILMCIDVYSRYLQARPMTNRKMETIIEKLKDIFDKMGKPVNLNADNEFNTNKFNQLMKDQNISVHYSQPYEINKNAIVERANRTIAQRIQKWRIATGKYDWPSILPKIVNNFNNSVNRNIKGTPNEIFKHKKQNLQRIIRVKPSFNVNDLVRIKIYKNVFAKGDSITYSKDLYTIEKIVANKYELKNIKTNEILKTLYKDYEIRKVNEIQFLPHEDQEQEVEHLQTQKNRKIKRKIRKEGIEDAEIISSKRKIVKPKLLNIAPKPKATKNVTEYEVEKLIAMKVIRGKVYYLVKWKGYPVAEATYEPRQTLIKDAPTLVRKYEAKLV
jgi:acid phosphatase class B